MIELRNTYNVTIKYGYHRQNSRTFWILADSIGEAGKIGMEWMVEQKYDNAEVTTVTRTGNMLTKIEEMYVN